MENELHFLINTLADDIEAGRVENVKWVGRYLRTLLIGKTEDGNPNPDVLTVWKTGDLVSGMTPAMDPGATRKVGRFVSYSDGSRGSSGFNNDALSKYAEIEIGQGVLYTVLTSSLRRVVVEEG